MKRRENLENKILIWKYLAIIFIVFSVLITAFIFYSPHYSKTFNYKKILFKGNYSGVEMYNVDMLIMSAKKEYLNTAKTITVTNRKQMFDIQGMNTDHNILIYYDNATTNEHFKEVLCHEILHNFVDKYDNEFFIKDLNQRLPCFYSI